MARVPEKNKNENKVPGTGHYGRPFSGWLHLKSCGLVFMSISGISYLSFPPDRIKLNVFLFLWLLPEIPVEILAVGI